MEPFDRAAALLARAGVALAVGLTDAELDAVEERYGLTFAPDHRAFLSWALPTGDGWPDWRHGPEAALRERVRWPVEGLLYDVEHNDLWLAGWPSRPVVTGEALAVAAGLLAGVPPLAPLYGHRYLPTVPHEPGNPVLSCYQADVVHYGADLRDWIERELAPGEPRGPVEPRRRVPFWSDVADGDL